MWDGNWTLLVTVKLKHIFLNKWVLMVGFSREWINKKKNRE